jgi:hypothetical protein
MGGRSICALCPTPWRSRTGIISRARQAIARAKPLSSPLRTAGKGNRCPRPHVHASRVATSQHAPVREPLPRITGVDLRQSEGRDATTSLVILSEMGLAMRRWPTVTHCTSWVGLCPHQRVSGGKVLSRRTTSCANRAATALRVAAAALHHSQRAFGAFCRRMQARLGAPQAITATAHKLARLIDTMLKHGTAYVRQGMVEYA